MQDNALRERIQGNWKQLQGSVRHEWGKLTHNDVEEIRGDLERFAGKIEERYGVTKAEARRQIERWVAAFLAHRAEQSKAEQAKSDAPAN